MFLLLQTYTNNITCQSPAVGAPATAAASKQQTESAASASAEHEVDMLTTLGWRHLYNPDGYSINAGLPVNCSLLTWNSLGSLKTLTNLTLTGKLPGLPASRAANGSFPALQTIDFSRATLAGSLPSSWSWKTAFPQLRALDLSATELSGNLPAWGQRGSFPKLTELYLEHTGIAGVTMLAPIRVTKAIMHFVQVPCSCTASQCCLCLSPLTW